MLKKERYQLRTVIAVVWCVSSSAPGTTIPNKLFLHLPENDMMQYFLPLTVRYREGRCSSGYLRLHRGMETQDIYNCSLK